MQSKAKATLLPWKIITPFQLIFPKQEVSTPLSQNIFHYSLNSQAVRGISEVDQLAAGVALQFSGSKFNVQ
jgi:hypothetical protein